MTGLVTLWSRWYNGTEGEKSRGRKAGRSRYREKLTVLQGIFANCVRNENKGIRGRIAVFETNASMARTKVNQKCQLEITFEKSHIWFARMTVVEIDRRDSLLHAGSEIEYADSKGKIWLELCRLSAKSISENPGK